MSAAANTSLSGLPDINQKLFQAKAKKGLTFDQIGKELKRDEVWVAAAFYGQAKFTPEDLSALSNVLDLAPEIKSTLGPESQWWPNRGHLIEGGVPKDPVVYRLYEGILVYGYAIKAIIHEKFGDGIMSLIDCKVTVERKTDPKGDRVLLTFDGKFLPYLTW